MNRQTEEARRYLADRVLAADQETALAQDGVSEVWNISWLLPPAPKTQPAVEVDRAPEVTVRFPLGPVQADRDSARVTLAPEQAVAALVSAVAALVSAAAALASAAALAPAQAVVALGLARAADMAVPAEVKTGSAAVVDMAVAAEATGRTSGR